MDKAEKLRTRDHILEVLLFYIARSPELNKELILRGGNALHFIYSSPRYSSDLDFVARDFREDIDKISKGLSDIDDTDSDKRLIRTDSKLKKDLLRNKYAYELGENKPFGRVEVLDDKVFEYIETKGKFKPLLVAVPSEIFADKIYATLNRVKTRGSFKGTDLFDLEYISERLKEEADEEKIEEKAKHYGYIGYDKETLDKVLLMICDQKLQNKFRRSIRRTMMPDLYNEKKFGEEYFEKCSEYFKRLKEVI